MWVCAASRRHRDRPLAVPRAVGDLRSDCAVKMLFTAGRRAPSPIGWGQYVGVGGDPETLGRSVHLGRGSMARVEARLAGIHVLVVEDHDDSREIWESVLRYWGALVMGANSARQAFQSYTTLRPDIVVTDLAMPGEDGIWLAEQLRARGERMPIIAVTGYAPIFAERLPGATFTRVMQKPVDPWHLVEAVAALVQ